MSFLHKRESMISSAKPTLKQFPYRKEMIKVCGFMDWDLYKREGKNCRGNNHIRHPLQKGEFFYPSSLQDFPNHFSILLTVSDFSFAA